MHRLLAVPAQVCPPQHLTPLQRFAGLVTLAKVLEVLAVAVIAIGIIFVFRGLIGKLLAFFKNVPIVVYEATSYVIAAAMIVGSWFTPHSVRPYLGLLGCLLFGAAVLFSTKLERKFAKNEVHISWILFAIWTPIAILQHNSMVGFIAVGALLAALGFSAAMTPLTYAIGFRDEKGLARATIAGFVILTGFVLIRITDIHDSVIHVFEFGALFMGSFVGYLGLLIASSKWYEDGRHYLWLQFVTIVAGVLALVVGSTLGIGELLKIGGSFFVLWMIEKLFEIPAKGVLGIGVKLLFIGGALFAAGMFISANIDTLGRFLP